MKNQDTAKIVKVLDILLGSFNLSDMNKISEAHRNGWKEYLNGSLSSQLAANKAQTATLNDIVEALPDNIIEIITESFNQ